MCGIAGIVGPRDPAAVERLTCALAHRGPDGRGWMDNGAAGVGATRLAIIDPGAPAQPVYDETGTLSLVFNGEIYNHHELRRELEATGHRFLTRTDSEVIVHLYEELGAACVHRLRGMFAFAVLAESELFLARDRLGIKPLYYAVDRASSTFVFASEIKAILAELPSSPTLDLQAFADGLVLNHLVGDQTLFEGVRTLPPGHTMRVRYGGGLQVGEPVRYFDRAFPRDSTLTYDAAEEQLVATFEDAVQTHLAADVEVALTLSGGIDSTLLALFAKEQAAEPLHTYTVVDHPDHPDAVQAEGVAKLIGAEHRTFVIDEAAYLDVIPRLVTSEESNASLFGLPFQYLCEQISGDVKACLHGEGADELFGGYVEYIDRGSRAAAFERRLPLLKHLGVAPSPLAQETILRLSAPGPFRDHVAAVFDVNLGSPLERLHLDVVDKCSMSVGVEMRVPYVDDVMVDTVCRMPIHHLVRTDIGVRKYILRLLALRRFAGAYGGQLVDVVLREKLGVPSSGIRMLGAFDERCERELPDDYLTRHELGPCFSRKRDLLLFEYFSETFLENRGDASAVGGIAEFIQARA